MAELNVIGQAKLPKGGREKVTGRAVFGTDVVLPRMLHARILRSPYPHAKIVSIDTSAATKHPGVHLVAIAKDAPKNYFGTGKADERFFAEDEVHYVGDEVAAVVAVDEETAYAALQLIKVEYEPLDAVFDPLEAVKEDAPIARLDIGSNICYEFEITRGDIDKGFRDATVVHEETYQFPFQYQAYIEPIAGIATWNQGRVTLWVPTQSPRQISTALCRAFNIERGAIRIIQTHIGGGFGGKRYQRAWMFAALLAKLSKTPVKIVLEREEDFQTSSPRMPMTIRLKMGADENGIVTAKDMYIVADNGAIYGSGHAIVDTAAMRVDSLYRFKNLHASGKLVYTNKLHASAFRGYGNVKGHFAVESMMDILADKLDMDPKEIRLRNATQAGDITAHGWEISSCGLTDTIHKATKIADWKQKRSRRDRRNNQKKYRGIGIACGLHVSGSSVSAPDGDGASAQVRVHEDGTVHVATSEGDIGQGANTAFAQIAAETLGVPYEKVFIGTLDTDVTYFGTGAVASRVTLVGGNAVKLGAIAAKERLIEAASHKWGCDREYVDLHNGILINMKSELQMSISEAATHYIGMTGGSRLMGEGFFRAEGVVVPDKNKYGNISLGYAFATHIAEVEVDVGTGHISVLGLWAVHDAGKVINPIIAEGQVEGGLAQGIGYALLEEYRFKDGHVLNPNFTDYSIPTALDVPEMIVDWIETYEPNGPFGAKSVGEIAMVPTAPAIANAVYDAVGLRMTTLPMTPERVFRALQESENKLEQ